MINFSQNCSRNLHQQSLGFDLWWTVLQTDLRIRSCADEMEALELLSSMCNASFQPDRGGAREESGGGLMERLVFEMVGV